MVANMHVLWWMCASICTGSVVIVFIQVSGDYFVCRCVQCMSAVSTWWSLITHHWLVHISHWMSDRLRLPLHDITAVIHIVDCYWTLYPTSVVMMPVTVQSNRQQHASQHWTCPNWSLSSDVFDDPTPQLASRQPAWSKITHLSTYVHDGEITGFRTIMTDCKCTAGQKLQNFGPIFDTSHLWRIVATKRRNFSVT